MLHRLVQPARRSPAAVQRRPGAAAAAIVQLMPVERDLVVVLRQTVVAVRRVHTRLLTARA